MTAYTFLLLAVIINTSANILLKLGASVPSHQVTFTVQGLLDSLVHYRLFAAGAILFGVTLIFYLLSLRLLPLTTAYPIFVGATFVAVNGYAALFLAEKVTVIGLVGIVLILTGIFMVTFTTQ